MQLLSSFPPVSRPPKDLKASRESQQEIASTSFAFASASVPTLTGHASDWCEDLLQPWLHQRSVASWIGPTLLLLLVHPGTKSSNIGLRNNGRPDPTSRKLVETSTQQQEVCPKLLRNKAGPHGHCNLLPLHGWRRGNSSATLPHRGEICVLGVGEAAQLHKMLRHSWWKPCEAETQALAVGRGTSPGPAHEISKVTWVAADIYIICIIKSNMFKEQNAIQWTWQLYKPVSYGTGRKDLWRPLAHPCLHRLLPGQWQDPSLLGPTCRDHGEDFPAKLVWRNWPFSRGLNCNAWVAWGECAAGRDCGWLYLQCSPCWSVNRLLKYLRGVASQLTSKWRAT